jgi:hypothetical protein
MANKIKAKQLDAGVGSGMYSPAPSAETVSTLLGGAEPRTAQVWSTYTVSQVLDELLFQYQPPSMATTILAGGASITTPRQVGHNLTSDPNVTITFGWTTNPPTINAQSNSVTIADYLGSPAISGGTPLNGQAITGNTNLTYANSSLTPAGAGTRSWTATGQNTNNQSYSSGKTITWAWLGYWGSSTAATPNASTITGLANKPLPAVLGDFAFPESSPNTFKYWAFESSIKPSSFKLGGFNFAMADLGDGFTESANGYNYKEISITNAYGRTATYNVYRSKNNFAGAITVVVG